MPHKWRQWSVKEKERQPMHIIPFDDQCDVVIKKQNIGEKKLENSECKWIIITIGKMFLFGQNFYLTTLNLQ